MNNDEHIANEIENIFAEAWKDAPRISNIDDLLKYLTTSVNESLNEIDALRHTLIMGKLTTVEGTDENPTKGAMEVKIMTTSDIPLTELLQDFTPKINELEFIAVSNRTENGSMHFIAFGNGYSYATCTSNDHDEFQIQDYDETIEMFEKYKDHPAFAKHNTEMAKLFNRLHEIASK